MTDSKYLNRIATKENEQKVLKLFNSAFGYDMPLALWQWKYQHSDTLGTVVEFQGEIVAFYGGMPRNILFFGSAMKAIQIGDVMVHPKVRWVLKNKGPFFQVSTHFLEQFVGQNKPYPIAFGFPSERSYRLARILDVYVKVDQIACVTWMPLKSRCSYKLQMRLLNSCQERIIDRLWHEMRDDLSDQIVGVRDSAYIKQRYFDHPTKRYQLYLITNRISGRAFGLVVIHVLNDAIELLDFIAPLKRFSTLIHFVRRLAFKLQKKSVYMWITAHNAKHLAGVDGNISSTDIIVPHNNWTPGISAKQVKDRWWLMGGDTDFH